MGWVDPSELPIKTSCLASRRGTASKPCSQTEAGTQVDDKATGGGEHSDKPSGWRERRYVKMRYRTRSAGLVGNKRTIKLGQDATCIIGFDSSSKVATTRIKPAFPPQKLQLASQIPS
eukprot:g36519.t1